MQEFPAVIPLLVYRDIEGAHGFLVRAFGFEAGDVYRGGDEEVVHGEVHAGGQLIWLHRVVEDDGWVSPQSTPVSTGELVVKVEDVDEHCERARVAGAEIEYEPTDMDYGDREYGARDLEGRRWAFVTRSADLVTQCYLGSKGAGRGERTRKRTQVTQCYLGSSA